MVIIFTKAFYEFTMINLVFLLSFENQNQSQNQNQNFQNQNQNFQNQNHQNQNHQNQNHTKTIKTKTIPKPKLKVLKFWFWCMPKQKISSDTFR